MQLPNPALSSRERYPGRNGLKDRLEKPQDTPLDLRFYFLLWWQQRRVKSPAAALRATRKGRESREGRGPSAGGWWVLRAREEPRLEVSSPSSKGSVPSRYLSSRKVHTWRRSVKGKGRGEGQLPLFIPPAHTPPCQQHHRVGNTFDVPGEERALSTDCTAP